MVKPERSPTIKPDPGMSHPAQTGSERVIGARGVAANPRH